MEILITGWLIDCHENAEEICEKTNHQVKYLKRDLQEAVDAGLLDADDSETALAVYRYVNPSDPVARKIVSLLA